MSAFGLISVVEIIRNSNSRKIRSVCDAELPPISTLEPLLIAIAYRIFMLAPPPGNSFAVTISMNAIVLASIWNTSFSILATRKL